MMAINSNANLQSKIDVSITETTDTPAQGTRTAVRSFDNGYLYSFTSGEGTGNINAGVFLAGSILSGESVSFDLRAIQEESFGTASTYTFTTLGAININNTSIISGANIKVRTTGAGATAADPGGGSNGWVNLWGGGPASGADLLLRPYATFPASDPYNALHVSDTNRYLSLFADGSLAHASGGCSGQVAGGPGTDGCWTYNLTIVGVTGA